MDRYSSGKGNAERPLWCEAFGGGPTGSIASRIRRPWCRTLTVAICGGIQPDRLASLLLDGDDDGLTARLLYLWPELPPLPGEDEEIPEPPYSIVDRLFKLVELKRTTRAKRSSCPSPTKLLASCAVGA